MYNCLLFYFWIQKASVSYGMYSCDWTSMDLKFKKLLLSSMQLNDADKLMVKATPTKIINLELFVKVDNNLLHSEVLQIINTIIIILRINR